jgi:hypothetical protein
MKLWLSSLLFLVALTHAGLAQERTYPDYNFAITPPEGWLVMSNFPPQKGVVTIFDNPGSTRLIMLVSIEEKKDSGILDDRFITNFEKGVESSGGGKRVSGKFIEVHGLKAYERLGGFLKGQQHVSTLTYLVLVNGRSYSFMGMRSDGAANDALDIQACFATFRFLTPPEPPKSSADSVAFQTGYVTGRVMVYVVLIIVACVVVASLRDKKSPPANSPPPSPPPQ